MQCAHIIQNSLLFYKIKIMCGIVRTSQNKMYIKGNIYAVNKQQQQQKNVAHNELFTFKEF